MYKKKLAACVLAATLGFGFMAEMPASQAATRAELAQISVNKKGTNFKYWNKEAASYRALTAYIKDVTNKPWIVTETQIRKKQNNCIISCVSDGVETTTDSRQLLDRSESFIYRPECL